MVANPSAFDPVGSTGGPPRARRNLVLQDMLQQGYISRTQYDQGRRQPLPTASDIAAAPGAAGRAVLHQLAASPDPRRDGRGRGVSPKVASYRAYYGGLKIRTTIDLPMQQAAEQAISQELPTGPGVPTASLVAIDNRTGAGASDGRRAARRRPARTSRSTRSTWPPRATASPARRSSRSRWRWRSSTATRPELGDRLPAAGPDRPQQRRQGALTSSRTSATRTRGRSRWPDATDGLRQQRVHAGRHPASAPSGSPAWPRKMGIRTPVSHNYAMIIGGLKEGVTPLDMAHAYETIAEGGRRVYAPKLGAPQRGPNRDRPDPVPGDQLQRQARPGRPPDYRRVIPASVAATVHEMLTGVVQHGTGQSRGDPGRRRGRQDRNHHRLRRRLVRRLDAADHHRGVGRLPEQAGLDDHDYNGGPVEGGTYPGDHLAELHGAGAPDPGLREGAVRTPSGTRRHRRRGTSVGTATAYQGGATATQAAPRRPPSRRVAPARAVRPRAPRRGPEPPAAAAGGPQPARHRRQPAAAPAPAAPTPAPGGGDGGGGNRRRDGGGGHRRRDGRRDGGATGGSGGTGLGGG